MPPAAAAFGPRDRIVVVGTGAAGWSAAGELRRLGFAGELVAIGAEPAGPYDRTACSKGLLNGHQRPRDTALDLRGHPDVIWRTGTRAIGLDPRTRRLLLDTGEALAYDGLVIATGTTARLPPGWPSGAGLHLLHGLADARSLRTALGTARSVAVVGGGLTGCEVACAVTAMARSAVLVNSQRYLMPRSVGEPVGALITVSHLAAGLDLRLGRKVADAERRKTGWRLLLDSGETVLGRPRGRHRGRATRRRLAGRHAGGHLGRRALRRDPAGRRAGRGRRGRRAGPLAGPAARDRGAPAGRAMDHGGGAGPRGRPDAADRRARAPPVSLLPRFWSDQNGLRIQVCGRLSDQADVHVTELRPRRRDTARAGVVADYVEDGRLTGVVAVNAPRAFTVACRTLLAEPAPAPVRVTIPEPA